MSKITNSIIRKIGLDGAIAYSGGARIVQGFTGVASIFFISTFLSDVEQGFYYTFGSILALQVFFELGLTGIMTQFVAHEVSHLKVTAEYYFEGESKYRSRLASLVQFCLKWYTVLGIIVFVSLLVVGYFYFLRYGKDSADWFYPWLLICIGTVIKLFQSPFTSILTGMGKVKEMSKIGFWQQIILPTTVWIGLACGFKLYVSGISYLFSVVLWIYFVFKDGLYKIIFNLLKIHVAERVSYIAEIFPYQWKIALSWISGYFIFQLFNPVLFATEGAVVAGQMGMTMAALNAISSLSMSWLTTKIPLYSRLIALKQYFELDVMHKSTLKQMLIVSSTLLTFFCLVILILQFIGFSFGEGLLADRFLGVLPILILCIPILTNIVVNSWATYLRCHKQEPYLILSIINGVLCMSSTLLLGYNYGLYGIIIGYASIQLFLIPWYYYIFIDKKREWHERKDTYNSYSNF